jgi:hypothetical protein
VSIRWPVPQPGPDPVKPSRIAGPPPVPEAVVDPVVNSLSIYLSRRPAMRRLVQYVLGEPLPAAPVVAPHGRPLQVTLADFPRRARRTMALQPWAVVVDEAVEPPGDPVAPFDPVKVELAPGRPHLRRGAKSTTSPRDWIFESTIRVNYPPAIHTVTRERRHLQPVQYAIRRPPVSAPAVVFRRPQITLAQLPGRARLADYRLRPPTVVGAVAPPATTRPHRTLMGVGV